MKLSRTERHIIKKSNSYFKEIDDLCFKSKNLYNFANYTIKQEYIKTKKYLNYYKVRKLLKEHETFKALPAQTSQQILRLLDKNWVSFFRAIKDFKKNPKKYRGTPKPPKYKTKNGRNILIYEKQTISKKFLRDESIIKPFKSNIKITTKQQNIQQVRFIPKSNCYICEVVYLKEQEINENLKKENILSIDLGVNNFVAALNNQGLRPFIINGRIMKSINQFYNKEKARLMSFIGNRGKSNRTEKLTFKRNNKINDYIHKSSRFVIDYCVNYNIGKIIIGCNKDWKQHINLRKKTNQNFVCIPFDKFIKQVQYKAEEVGIEVILTEESYTSKCDHLAFEPMEHQENYLGKRVKRGLFKSSTGKFVNGDIHGALGIMRKSISDAELQNFLADIGTVFVPVKVVPERHHPLEGFDNEDFLKNFIKKLNNF